jgi:amino acid transporter
MSQAPGLVREVGLLGLTAIAINGVIGSGIFVLPATVAGLMGDASPVAYLVAGSLTGLVVLCFAEAGSLFEQTGGPYIYAREAFGRFIGFEVGFMFFLSRLAAGAAIANAFTAYVAQFWPDVGAGVGRAAVITLLVGVLTAVNLVGVRYGSWTVNVLTVAKLLPLFLLLAVGLPMANPESYRLLAIPDGAALRQAALLLVFAFGGFENANVPSEEAQNPRRDLPAALVFAIASTAVLYVLIQIVALGTVPSLATEKAPLAAAGRAVLGPAGAVLITVCAVVSTSGSLSAIALVGPRILYAFAQGRQLPAALGSVHPRFRTPHVGILLFALLVWAAALSGSFAQLAAVSAIARLLFSAATCLAVPVLRRKMPDARRRLKVPGGVLVPVTASAVSLWLLSGITAPQAATGTVALLVGAVLGLLTTRGKP